MRSTSAAGLLETLNRFLAEESLGAGVAVGYSGGRDSGVLLWALVQALGADRVSALHVDHGWRSEAERAAELALVEGVCRGWGAALVHWGPPSPVVPTEAGARTHRYQCFSEFLASRPGTLVFLGHHADDQAETILMRLLKGRSWQGLSGMPLRRGPFRRPFLEVSGAVVGQVALEVALPYHSDTSNADLSPARNYLRRRLFPAIEHRFPQASQALAAFGAVWAQAALLQTPHPQWTQSGRGYLVSTGVWAHWSGLERQAQLLAVCNGLAPTFRPSRRFLETISVKTGGRVKGAGWEWSWTPEAVSWGPVAPGDGKEYFIHAAPGRIYDLGAYQVSWTTDGSGLRVPGIDPLRPWVWRSVVPGMRFSSEDNPDWGKDLRKKRLGSSSTSNVALVVQDGMIRAVVDPQRKGLVWAESGEEKLHKRGIFVTLVTVTPISTE